MRFRRLAWPATIAMLPLAAVIPAVIPDEHEPRRLIRANAEEGRDYGLGFVEFNDNGLLRADWQLSELLDYAHSEGQTGRGIILVTFIHGWNSNCHDCNGNLECFKEVLAAIADLQRKIDSRRRVIGVYLGWRGSRLQPGVLNQVLTFWNRIDTAKQIGEVGDLHRVLWELGEVKRKLKLLNKTSLMVVSAHSMGARALFYALRPDLEREINAASSSAWCLRGDLHPLNVSTDLTVLVNPAFSAIEYASIARFATGKARNQAGICPPKMLVVSSDADPATSKLYPLAMKLKFRFDPAEYTTIGNFPEFQTHRLRVVRGSVPATAPLPVTGCACSKVSANELTSLWDRVQNGSLFEYDSIERPGYALALEANGHPAGPYYVMRVDNQVLIGHSQFYTPAFLDFLIRIVNSKVFLHIG
jgi:hypothetical protein